MWPSAVVPGHSYAEKNSFHPMSDNRVVPPEWCERALEQVVLKPDEAVEFEADANVVFDGNPAGEIHLRERKTF